MKTQLLALAFSLALAQAQSQTFQWAKKMGGTNGDFGTAVTTDAAGNVYTTGYFNGTADFDPGAGTANLTSAGAQDVFICKFNSSGNYVWAKRIGGSVASDQGLGIAVDASGNVYTTGTFGGTVDFNPGSGSANLTSAGGLDIFVSKLDASGNYVWGKKMGGTNNDIGYGIVLDAGNVYTTGAFMGTADFDPSASTASLTTAGIQDVFVSKLDASGNYVFAKAMGGASFDIGHSIALDGPGNIYTAGNFQGTADFDPGAGTQNQTSLGNYDVFISKLTAAGNFSMIKIIGGANPDMGLSIAVDGTGNIYSTGSFQGTVDFDPGAGTANLTSAGAEDIFVSKLNSSGNYVWGKAMGGTTIDIGNGITVDGSGNVYTTGTFSAIADFDPGAGTSSFTSAGAEDIFVSKLNSSGALVWTAAMGAAGTDIGSAATLDGSGNIHTVGYFSNTVDFDPGPGTSNLVSAGGIDVYVHKMGTLVGMNAIAIAGSLTIYPNPSSGAFTITNEKEILEIEIYNVLGEKTGNWQLAIGKKETTIDLSAQPGGIYFVRVQTEEGVATKKVVIQ